MKISHDSKRFLPMSGYPGLWSILIFISLILSSLPVCNGQTPEEKTVAGQSVSLNGINRDSLIRAIIAERIDSLKMHATGFPVVPFPGDTLFMIFLKTGSFSAEERARIIGERIQQIADDYVFEPDSVHVETSDWFTDIMYSDQVIMSITEGDAIWYGTTTTLLARDYADRISHSIRQYTQEISYQNLLVKVLWVILVIAGLVFLYILLSKFFLWSRKKLDFIGKKYFRGIKIRDYELINVDKEVRILFFISALMKWTIILIAFYFALYIVFGLFPWTRQLAAVLLGYFVNPLKSILQAVWDYLPNLFTIVVIVVVFMYVLKGLRYLRKEIARESLKIPGFYPDLANPTYQIARVLVLAFMIVVIFPYLPGSNSPVFQGVSVFLGLLFTFGSSGSLSNLISGLVITFMRSFKLGDQIRIGDTFGQVIEKSMLVTRIRTPKNEIVSIPNSNVLGSSMINYSMDARDRGLIINTTVTIGYDASWRQIHQLLIDAALATEMIEKSPQPFVLQTSLNDFYVSYQINAYTRESTMQPLIYSKLHQNIQDKFNEAGVEIMSPHYSSLRDGNTTTIPPSYLPGDYQPPSFHVSDR